MAGTPKTLAFNFLAKTQKQADSLIKKYGQNFDEIVYEVGKVTNFAEARNRLLGRTKSEFMFWCDTDDEVWGIHNLHHIIDDMGGIDALYLPYEYAYNELGECTLLQWRERIIRTAHPFKWKGAVHETLISGNGPALDRTKTIVIKHIKTDQQSEASAKRNHGILLKSWKQDKDPRTAHYLGISYFNLHQYEKAIKLFKEHIATSGWDEEIYRSYFWMTQTYLLLDQPSEALKCAAEGTTVMPNRPELYVGMADAAQALSRYSDVLEYLGVASTKKPPDTLSPIDPTYYGYRAEMLGALAWLYKGRPKEALAQLKIVLQHSPDFQTAKDLLPLFEQAYFETEAIERVKWLVSYLHNHKGKPLKVLEALPSTLLSDARLNATRSLVVPPKKWPKKSIVFLCGDTTELWGPEYLGEKGIGGSEEAIIYLSRELAKQGWAVTVYNERDEAYVDGGKIPLVTYLPLTTFNPTDTFDVLVAWRQPQLYAQFDFKARLKCVDLHDTPVGHAHITDKALAGTDLFFFKSQFQRRMAPHLPDDKCVIAPNGIVPQHFNHQVNRNPLKVVYGSSYDRGLRCLLDLWPQIKKQVPEAELHIYYGWNTFDGMHRNNPKQGKWKLETIRAIYDAGATDHGRLSHEELAKEYLSAGVWAYPTEFPEISCITAMKAGAAGLESITTRFAALNETILDVVGLDSQAEEDIYTNPERQQAFIGKLVRALTDSYNLDFRQVNAQRYLDEYAWSSVAKLWTEALYGPLHV